MIGPASVALIVAFALVASGQTRVDPPKNSYKPSDDVQLGREAAAQAEQQFPILRDDGLTSYVSDVGRRLVGAIPADLQHPEFQYSFKVVNVKEINAFALLATRRVRALTKHYAVTEDQPRLSLPVRPYNPPVGPYPRHPSRRLRSHGPDRERRNG